MRQRRSLAVDDLIRPPAFRKSLLMPASLSLGAKECQLIQQQVALFFELDQSSEVFTGVIHRETCRAVLRQS